MRAVPGRRLLAGLTASVLLALAPAQAAMLKTYPVRLALSPDEPVTTLTIQNSGAEATRLQLRVMAWSQENGEDVFHPTRDVLANPGMFELAPGAQQIARLGLQTGATPSEGSYRVFVQEVPTREAGKPGEVVTLLQISIPIFTPAKGATNQLVWSLDTQSADKASLLVRNTGGGHVQVTSLTMTRADGQVVSDQKMSVYVLPGAWRRASVDLKSPLKRGDRLTFRAETDQAPLSGVLVVGEAAPDGSQPR